MTDILHWTEGQGTGHIKRINALLRSSDQTSGIRYWVRAEDPKFHSLLPPNVNYWDGHQPSKFDLVVLDLEDELEECSLLECSDKWIQLCRIGTPLDLPDAINDSAIRLSFERCALHENLEMPYFGSLLDASSDQVFSQAEARARLRRLCDFNEHDGVALTHANSANAQAAYEYLESAIEKLLKNYAHVFAVTGHVECQNALRSTFNNQPVTVCSINPIYSYYPAFDALLAPMGYNTYHEVHLFYQGEVEFRSMYPPDQALRAQERPRVDRIANREIFDFIKQVACS